MSVGICVLRMPMHACTYELSLSYIYIDNYIYNLLPRRQCMFDAIGTSIYFKKALSQSMG